MCILSPSNPEYDSLLSVLRISKLSPVCRQAGKEKFLSFVSNENAILLGQFYICNREPKKNELIFNWAKNFHQIEHKNR